MGIKEDVSLSGKIREAFLEVRQKFPFKDYMEPKLDKYLTICRIIMQEVPRGSKILDIGCGPCDLAAILSRLGYNVTGLDDLRDSWHLIGRNRERIKKFAEEMNIRFIQATIESARVDQDSFDAVLLMDIIEHILNPRLLLNRSISVLKNGGVLMIETPNHAALAKRIRLILGKPVYPEAGLIFFAVGEYRGHVKEYVVSELLYILKLIGLTALKVKTENIMTKELLRKSQDLKILLKTYDLMSSIFPNFKDTIIAWGRKPKGWIPFDNLLAFKNWKKYYPHIVNYNLDGEDDYQILSKIESEGDNVR